jgi:hypothetical protein
MCYFHTVSPFPKLFPFMQLFLSASLLFCVVHFFIRHICISGARGGGSELEENFSGKSFFLTFL